MMYANNMGSGGWVISIIGTLIIVVLVVAGVFWLASGRGARR
jgi:heme/copper-type cytochrome/quinol oxidase subunit 4